MPHAHVVQFSAGLSSFFAAVRVAERHGTAGLTLLFTDTLAEDADAYRFLIEAVANLYGIRSPAVAELAAACRGIPPEHEDTLDARRAALGAIRIAASELFPQLVWLADGRTPWEVCFDERFMANSRVDPCSRVLKREQAARWRDINCDPSATTLYLGFTWDETGRQERLLKNAAGWRIEFPMDAAPYATKLSMMQDCRAMGIQPPRLYFWGFKHNNCGGRCFKGGHAAYALALNRIPDLYAYDERQEGRFGEVVTEATILTDRSGKQRRRISLRQFRERVQSGGAVDGSDWGACSCFDFDVNVA